MAFRHGVLGEKEEGSELTSSDDTYSVAAAGASGFSTVLDRGILRSC